MRRLIDGAWMELEVAAEHLLKNVVPKLLDPLQEGDEPPLFHDFIHGDLWSGNIGTDSETGEIVFVDPGSFYAHNEMEMGMWRRYGVQNLGKEFVDEYLRVSSG